jgi:PPOX class probable F420-dependent enzyme
MIFDSGSDRDRRALERLETDLVAWLSTVTPDGQPQTLPIWFLWDGSTIMFYSDNRAQRNRNLVANPKVSFHFSDDAGNDIVFIEGEAVIDGTQPAPADNEAWLAKYGSLIDANLGGTQEYAKRYDVPIVIRPVRGRSPY